MQVYASTTEFNDIEQLILQENLWKNMDEP